MKKFFVIASLIALSAASAQTLKPIAKSPDAVTYDLGVANSNLKSLKSTYVYANLTVKEALYTGEKGQLTGSITVGTDWKDKVGYAEGTLNYLFANSSTNVYTTVRQNFVANCPNYCSFGKYGTTLKLGVTGSLR